MIQHPPLNNPPLTLRFAQGRGPSGLKTQLPRMKNLRGSGTCSPIEMVDQISLQNDPERPIGDPCEAFTSDQYYVTILI